MTDHFSVQTWKSVQASPGKWYKAIELLGVGGNAATFLAYCSTNPEKGILFAIKVFRRRSKPERRASFLEEARILRGLSHAAIMRVFDDGVYYDSPFMVFEYLPQTLAQVMRAGCSVIERISYAMQLLAALDCLSSANPQLVHRDIKPGNIFIKGGSCVLGDFGLVKVLDGVEGEDKEIIKESIGAGMPYYYRTPDLVDYLLGKAPVTTKSDVFQLGLVLAHLFTGRNPLVPGKDFTDPLHLEPLSQIQGQFGSSIAALIRRMLEFDPAARPAAHELIDGWEGVFRDAVNVAHQLEGTAFYR
jgi:serine/threonine protein kinase